MPASNASHSQCRSIHLSRNRCLREQAPDASVSADPCTACRYAQMIENYLLEQFAAVAECGTLLKASEKLHISQPSLSRSMHKIEDEFGVSLFHRANSKIELNETGKIAAEYVPEHRNTIPITNPEVHITYWLAALNSEQKTYRSVFNTVCGNVLKEKAERDRESYIQPRPCYS